MSIQTHEDVLQQAEKLPPDQRLMLIERLIHHLRTSEPGRAAAPAWEDYAGTAPYPLCGEDAQEYVSRGRKESAEAIELRDAYLSAGIVGDASRDDAQHVALATILECSAIVSWNFGHIVHARKIPLYNGVNKSHGYKEIAIHTPQEVIEYEGEV